jgi:hypothetical protein
LERYIARLRMHGVVRRGTTGDLQRSVGSGQSTIKFLSRGFGGTNRNATPFNGRIKRVQTRRVRGGDRAEGVQRDRFGRSEFVARELHGTRTFSHMCASGTLVML